MGYVDNVEALKAVRKDNPKYKVFKFTINNTTGRRMTVACWGKDAIKWSSKITTNKVCKTNYKKIILEFCSLIFKGQHNFYLFDFNFVGHSNNQTGL